MTDGCISMVASRLVCSSLFLVTIAHAHVRVYLSIIKLDDLSGGLGGKPHVM